MVDIMYKHKNMFSCLRTPHLEAIIAPKPL